MDFDLPADEDPRRSAVRAWLVNHPNPTGTQLAEAGYVVPHWPSPWGMNADPIHQLIIDQELGRADVALPDNGIGIAWAAPTILLAGTEAQKQRYLARIFSGEDIWCQLFSEPDSGSDLASLSTRATRDGDEYVVNGSKTWSSGAHNSRFGILLARTNPDVAKHKGISYFICPMDSTGITMQPIIDMTGAHSLNQVFFDDVRIPTSHRIGDEGDGWRLAKVTLANERASLSSGGALWGSGPSARTLLEIVRANGGVAVPRLRQRLAQLFCEAEVLRLTQLRTLTTRLQGKTPGTGASIQKIMSDEHGQRVLTIAQDLVGAATMVAGSGPAGTLMARDRTAPTEVNVPADDSGRFSSVDPIWHYGYLFSPALTLGGGTFAVQRNIVAEQVLGLPKDPDVEKGLTWAETQRRS